MKEFTEDMEKEGKHKAKHQRMDSNKVLPSAKHKLWDNDTLIQEEEEEVTISDNLPQAVRHIGEVVGDRTSV